MHADGALYAVKFIYVDVHVVLCFA